MGNNNTWETGDTEFEVRRCGGHKTSNLMVDLEEMQINNVDTRNQRFQNLHNKILIYGKPIVYGVKYSSLAVYSMLVTCDKPGKVFP